jgi:hypothetical protein
MSMQHPTILTITPNITIARLGDTMLIAHWRGTPDLADVEKVGEVTEAYRNTIDKSILELVVIDAHVSVPSDEIRQILVRRMQARDLRTTGTAIVYEGTGFYAAAIRSVLTAMQLTSKRRSPMRVFSTVEEAAQYLSKAGWVTHGVNVTLSAIESIRSSTKPDGK